MASTEYEFTSDMEIEAFNHEDKAMDLTGYIDAIDGIKELKTAQGHVLKFVLNNNSKSRMRVLIWGTAQATKYEPFIRLNAIVEVTGGSIRLSNPSFRNPNEVISLLEFHVQSYSTLSFHGEFKSIAAMPIATFQPTPFTDVMIVDGPIEIQGYLKSNGFCEVNTTNASCGHGTVVDGHYRLIVQIASYSNNPNLQRGVHLKLRGVMNKQVGDGFRISDMNGIDVLEDEVMSCEDMKKSIHNVMLIKTKRPNSTEEEPNAKRMNMDDAV